MPVTRRCTVPADAALFFPVITFSADNGGVPMPASDEQLRASVVNSLDGATASASLDGCEIPGIAGFRSGLAEFAYDCPTGDCVYQTFGSDFSGHVEPAYAIGHSLLFAPLPSGTHTVHFEGTYDGGTPDDAADDFTLDTTYELTVE